MCNVIIRAWLFSSHAHIFKGANMTNLGITRKASIITKKCKFHHYEARNNALNDKTNRMEPVCLML